MPLPLHLYLVKKWKKLLVLPNLCGQNFHRRLSLARQPLAILWNGFRPNPILYLPLIFPKNRLSMEKADFLLDLSMWISFALLAFIALVPFTVIAAYKLICKLRLCLSCLRRILIAAAFVKFLSHETPSFLIHF